MSDDRKIEVEEALALSEKAEKEQSEEIVQKSRVEGATEGSIREHPGGMKVKAAFNPETNDEREWAAEHDEPYAPGVEFAERVEEVAKEIFGEGNFGYMMYVASPLPDGDWEEGAGMLSSRKNSSLTDDQLKNVVMAEIAVSALLGREHPSILIQLAMAGESLLDDLVDHYRREEGHGEQEGED